MNIALDYADFKCLVRGGVLNIGEARIILQDIGFENMRKAIKSAEKGIDIYKELTSNSGESE